MKDLGHGANVEQIANIYNKNPKDIIDFSSNINPKIIKGLETYILEGLQESRSYPDINYTNLRNNISKYIDIKPEFIIPGNGATEIIYLLMKSIDKRIAIMNPTFSEYERGARLNNLEVINFSLDESNEFEINLNKIKENIDKFKHLNIPFETGVIIAKGYIDDCVLAKDVEEDLIRKDPLVYGQSKNREGYAFHIKHIKLIKPIKINGKLGFWEYNEEKS